jgi:hypothetical protein
LDDDLGIQTLLAPNLLDGLIEVAAHRLASSVRTSPEL